MLSFFINKIFDVPSKNQDSKNQWYSRTVPVTAFFVTHGGQIRHSCTAIQKNRNSSIHWTYLEQWNSMRIHQISRCLPSLNHMMTNMTCHLWKNKNPTSKSWTRSFYLNFSRLLESDPFIIEHVFNKGFVLLRVPRTRFCSVMGNATWERWHPKIRSRVAVFGRELPINLNQLGCPPSLVCICSIVGNKTRRTTI